MLFLRKNAPRAIFARRNFQLPPGYRAESIRMEKLPFGRKMAIWLHSLRPNRLRELQRQLIDLYFPETKHVTVEEVKTPIDSKNHINEVVFRVQNGQNLPSRHVVFVHGYGASLGCFARNFHMVEELRGKDSNFVVHFLDNISFGLSSNPKMDSVPYWGRIPRVDFLRLGPGQKQPVFHKKYYQLLEYFDICRSKQRLHAAKMTPILEEMENYYVGALEKWRQSWGIEQIDYLVGHSFGGYWSGCYAIKHASSVRNLVLLSPVGVERHAAAITASSDDLKGLRDSSLDAQTSSLDAQTSSLDAQTSSLDAPLRIKPSLDPVSYAFLGKFPNLSKKTVDFWYNVQPYLPQLLRLMGPFGVQKYHEMWYSKLFAINKVVHKLGGAAKVLTNEKQLVFGTNKEVGLLIEYLYNSITSGTNSDIHVKYLLTPATTSRWPLYDRFLSAGRLPQCHVVYGEYDFMCSEAGEKLVAELQRRGVDAHFHTVAQGGHNLYIQNPFGTNQLLTAIMGVQKNPKSGEN